MSYLMTDLTVTPGNTVYYIWLGFFFKKATLHFINSSDCLNIIFILFCLNIVRNIDKRNSQWTVPEWNQPNMPALGPGETLSKRAGKKIKQRWRLVIAKLSFSSTFYRDNEIILINRHVYSYINGFFFIFRTNIDRPLPAIPNSSSTSTSVHFRVGQIC